MIIFTHDVLEHIKDDDLALKKLKKLLKSGEQILITVPAYNFYFPKKMKL